MSYFINFIKKFNKSGEAAVKHHLSLFLFFRQQISSQKASQQQYPQSEWSIIAAKRFSKYVSPYFALWVVWLIRSALCRRGYAEYRIISPITPISDASSCVRQQAIKPPLRVYAAGTSHTTYYYIPRQQRREQ